MNVNEMREDLIQRIEEFKFQMRCKEMADDFYYTSGGHREDTACLNQMKKHLAELEAMQR
jgi:hypothetical protein